MIHKDLNELIEQMLDRDKRIFMSKNDEYAREDALSNFKKAGNAKNCTPEDALIGMLVKHWVSIVDIVADLDQGKVAPLELWQEKCGDLRVYGLLLEALATERLQGGDKN